MIIEEVHVKTFRSILDQLLPRDCLTALVDRNWVGDSSFLLAMEMPQPMRVRKDSPPHGGRRS